MVRRMTEDAYLGRCISDGYGTAEEAVRHVNNPSQKTQVVPRGTDAVGGKAGRIVRHVARDLTGAGGGNTGSRGNEQGRR